MTALSRRDFLRITGTASASLSLLPGPARAQSREPIKIGFPIPLTGPYGAEAADQQAGAALAVEEV
ncbi:MAG: twin-arginine translocation signal domain-containing protein, partial [Candidatus Rokubacteria bacterium]|nr:twin-arginine translocation signal domain-containing protein [Candidatus Rokubacteria bacterium]